MNVKNRASQDAAQSARTLRDPMDWLLVSLVITLMAVGVVTVFGASNVFASETYHNGYYFLIRQSVYALLGLGVMWMASRLRYELWRKLTYPLLGGSVVLLLLTLLGLGHRAKGAARWIDLGVIHIQPSEIVKFALVVWLAYSLSKKTERIKSFSVGFLPHVLMATFIIGLCLLQPDFGSAAMVGVLTFVMLFTAGARVGYIMGALLFVAPIAYTLIATSEYRRKRILAFLEPLQHRYDIGYQISESLMSFGAGGTWGLGAGESRQKLFFLPEAHTDFIGAIIGEEFGFVGVAAIVALFTMLIIRGLRVAFNAKDDYGTFLAVGITLFIGLQALVNWSVTLGMLPTKGLGLPFVSYGGSSLLVNCLAVGVVLNVSRDAKTTLNELGA